MYYLSIYADGEPLESRVAYPDYAEAVAACGKYYESRFKGSVLVFSSEVIGKEFMRSYAQLPRLQDLGADLDRSSPQAHQAVKLENAFIYSRSYTFLIESEPGMRETDRTRAEDSEDEAPVA